MNHSEIQNCLVKVAELAGEQISHAEICVEFLPAPHTPPKPLPKGKMAIYIFLLGEQCLKVGKVGPKSNARYTIQHYSPNSSNSNLAKSILSDNSYSDQNLSETNVGQWIQNNTNRINLIIDLKHGVPLLSLFETFLHCKLKPRYEGFESQRQIVT